jgi:hypothetical protein
VNVALWVVQLLTALAFGQHGYSLLFGLERARKRLAWTRDVETGILRFIGVAEILGAVGVLLPAATGILPWLSARCLRRTSTLWADRFSKATASASALQWVASENSPARS